MKPIDDRADIAYMEALRCVAYRIPVRGEMKESSYQIALGLRYGLVGVAASHFLLLGADPEEESEVISFIRSWPHMVEEDVRYVMADRLPLTRTEGLPARISQLALQPLRQYLPLYRQFVPLERCLKLISDRFVQEHDAMIRGPIWLAHRLARRDFRTIAEDSVRFAASFFERREYGLEEVREIALIGE